MDVTTHLCILAVITSILYTLAHRGRHQGYVCLAASLNYGGGAERWRSTVWMSAGILASVQ